MKISLDICENIKYLDEIFKDCGDIVKRKIPIGNTIKKDIYIIYIDNLASKTVVESNLLRRIMFINSGQRVYTDAKNIFDEIKNNWITSADISQSNDFNAINQGILSGDAILFIDNCDEAIIISAKEFPTRGIQSAETEVAVQGSKESFNEVFRFSTALIRRRIRDTNLKLKQLKLGTRSDTDVGIMYLDDVVRKDILNEVLSRIKNIKIDAMQDIGYIEQFIEDDWISPFPQAQITERPDKAAAAILEGRIVIIVDNSPFVLIVPATLNTFFQASEDYYQRWSIMSFVRILRFIAGFFAICLPGLYIAIAVFHPSMLPMLLTFKIASARQNVPFPAIVEIIIMELAFELLREAGIRLPGAIGSTIGIVGGLIIGQAAVEAGIVSPIVVIIVALTGISSFTIPHISLVSGFRIMKFLIIISSGVLGLYGFWLSLIFILIHLVSLKSFGIPYMFPYVSPDVNDYSDVKDTLFRAPIFWMKKRPIFANPDENIRMNLKMTGNKRNRE